MRPTLAPQGPVFRDSAQYIECTASPCIEVLSWVIRSETRPRCRRRREAERLSGDGLLLRRVRLGSIAGAESARSTAVKQIRAPVVLTHAASDYSVSSGKVLDARLDQLGKPYFLERFIPNWQQTRRRDAICRSWEFLCGSQTSRVSRRAHAAVIPSAWYARHRSTGLLTSACTGSIGSRPSTRGTHERASE